MMGRRLLLTVGIVAAIGLGASALAVAHGPSGSDSDQPYGWHQGWHMGPGMMGQQHHGPMMGPGRGYGMMDQHHYGPMMGPGMGYGKMGPQGQMPTWGRGWGPGMGQGTMQPLRQDLSTDDVQHMMEHRLAWHGNPNIKLGKVEQKDEDTIVAEIVTKDGSLIQQLEVDRHTGQMRPAQ